ncbi:MAG TPA: uroporphyrinogen decarboxylase family protein [Armatimonadota bacterium]|jgi:hypothetical protein|nr:uroporphyrinogen decarboxylase family protein [Armatimonadota bacterium]
MTTPFAPSDRLYGIDWQAHNAEVKAVWDAFNAGKPIRTPVIVGVTTRYFIDNPDANPDGIDFKAYTEDVDLMFDTQLRFASWSARNILQDAQLGLPDKWVLSVDFQNYWESAWFGCEIEYLAGNVPDTRPAFSGNPESVMDRGMPDPFGGIMARGLEYHERFVERAANETFLERPIEVLPPWYGTGGNGVMTVACSLFGPDFVCMTMAEDPDRIHRLFRFINDATIARMKAWRERTGVPVPQDGFGYMDDSVPMISLPTFKRCVLPYLKDIYDTFGTGKNHACHMCGDATRHFTALRDECKVVNFDTGFPVDFGKLRKDLGPDVIINGGPHIELLRIATPQQAYDESVRILQSGILEGGMFVLREGNNLAPGTPLENTEAMYRAGREHGYRSEES